MPCHFFLVPGPLVGFWWLPPAPGAAKAAAPRRSLGRVPNLDQPLDLSGFKFSKGAKAELAAGMFKAGVAAFGPVGKVRK